MPCLNEFEESTLTKSAAVEMLLKVDKGSNFGNFR
jgi:hypothetical protein